MAISPFKHKHNVSAAYKGVKFVDVVNIKDGMTRRFTDDGPYEVDAAGKPIDGWQTKTRQSGAANTIKKLRHQEADPLGGPDGNDPDAVINVFVFDGDGPAPKVWDNVSRSYVSAVKMTAHHRKVMEKFCAGRDQVMRQASARAEREKAAREAKDAENADRILDALAARATRKPPEQPKAKDAKAGVA